MERRSLHRKASMATGGQSVAASLRLAGYWLPRFGAQSRRHMVPIFDASPAITKLTPLHSTPLQLQLQLQPQLQLQL